MAVEPLVIFVPEETAYDWGDAPNTYATLAASGGPSHGIFETLYLGAQEDGETDGLATTGANGDDTTGVDDEDGVVVADLALTEGSSAVVRVTATNQTTSPAFLSGWIDFDGNGQFESSERASTTVTAGSFQQQVQLNFGTVPANAPATTYARFRLTTDEAGTLPTGPARDGEVEDYVVTITPTPEPDQIDWGDAPDTGTGASAGNYNTSASDNGPRHTIVANLAMGSLIDAETDGQPTSNANGDDTTGVDDEDGVTIPALVEGETAIVTVNVTNLSGVGAQLYGWIDFNANGVFETGERVTAAVPTGAAAADVTLNFGIVPANGVTQTYARFRLSSDAAAAQPIGPAQDGEVEDYVVTISAGPEDAFDWGDAPDSGPGTGAGNYSTLAGDNGPRHVLVDGLRLGLRVDAETDGQPTATANGDDINPPTALDDEDGVNPFDLALTEGDGALVRVTATNQLNVDAVLYGWIDFDGNGVFDLSERAAITVTAGALNMVVNLDFGTVPANGLTETMARFRLSTDGAAGAPTGAAADGEVEDHRVTITSIVDWGDAPDGAIGTGTGNYNTLAADNGPSHRVISGLHIGAIVDGENDGQPTVDANGDDTSPAGAADDEDGVLVSDLNLEEGQAAVVTVIVTNSTQESAVLYGWVDFNANGIFDATESAQVVIPADSVLRPVTLDFGLVPANAVTQTYARFRLSTDTAAASPTGPAANGEVEDYVVVINPRPAAIDLVSFTAEAVDGVNRVRWTTAGEVDTNGFHLYRSTTKERKDAVRITAAMIPAQGPNGGAYGYDDVAVVPGVRYSYWLVEVENGAEAAEYGPVAAAVRSDQVMTHAVFLPMVVRR
ncbi:MAG: GEVED domain-containing protein [Caldilineaceae bacterium]